MMTILPGMDLTQRKALTDARSPLAAPACSTPSRSGPIHEMRHGLDIVGDVHGQVGALRELGRHLGYDVECGWAHAGDRALVFLGDLVDRGEDSLGAVELVRDLVDSGRAVCLMGNHEYNLVGHAFGLEQARSSNRGTLAEIAAHPGRWSSAIAFLRGLPLAIDLPELRLVHAVWHRRCFALVEPVMVPPRPAPRGHPATDWLRHHTVIGSPYSVAGLLVGLPEEPAVPPARHRAHEILLRGPEVSGSRASQGDGEARSGVRTAWWESEDPEIPRDKITVFGHYWNLPPVPGLHSSFVPLHARRTAGFEHWLHRVVGHVPPQGLVDVPRSVEFVCVDYSAVLGVGAATCVGAYRWPEHQVAWARAAIERGDGRRG
jgi:hypothetical protein